jgi:hypothetical protein
VAVGVALGVAVKVGGTSVGVREGVALALGVGLGVGVTVGDGANVAVAVWVSDGSARDVGDTTDCESAVPEALHAATKTARMIRPIKRTITGKV